MNCVACGNILTAKEERYTDIVGFQECIACREKRNGGKTMQIGDTVYWKGKPAKIFGQGSRDGVVFQYSIMMLNNRRFPAILNVSPKSKHLKSQMENIEEQARDFKQWAENVPLTDQ